MLMKQLHIRLSEEIKKKLKKEAYEKDVTMNSIINKIIEGYYK